APAVGNRGEFGKFINGVFTLLARGSHAATSFRVAGKKGAENMAILPFLVLRLFRPVLNCGDAAGHDQVRESAGWLKKPYKVGQQVFPTQWVLYSLLPPAKAVDKLKPLISGAVSRLVMVFSAPDHSIPTRHK
ncbi:MAG: hypothetical protein SPI14_01685, partial [Arcanobacterium sp.]|nr:hypothetical protein [Arcanobacterium sp.]